MPFFRLWLQAAFNPYGCRCCFLLVFLVILIFEYTLYKIDCEAWADARKKGVKNVKEQLDDGFVHGGVHVRIDRAGAGGELAVAEMVAP